MPSLRRTVSSPAVRSSPYPTLSSSSQINSGPATRPGHSHRRSSGSETYTRRVLADIEWWRVTDGQRDWEAEQEDHEQSSPRLAENIVDSLEGLVSPVWPGFLADLPELLSIVPQTPPRHGHHLESSTSSVESTPDLLDRSVESLRLGLQYVNLSASDVLLPPAHSGEQATTYMPLSHSHSLMNEAAVPHNDYPAFAVSPLSSQSPDFFN
ncbi:hypothetical protein J3R30DRAFT_840474 [Lentinula aciculospora]|uniref:Uncharacterized protein n=1 Tax=Lentinula aciculospora TaxID=153920 RepID=A0A9W9ASU2_9AGAR|nr:hypothetical protein J3R30DRAFT_840474 [Lentinula aciculospora]